MTAMLRFSGASVRDETIEEWLRRGDTLTETARLWFTRMRACGPDVRELFHDGCPVACVDDAPFAYVNVFKDHTNVGFFYGAHLADPLGLMEGTGKNMRHVKIKPGRAFDPKHLEELIGAAYLDLKLRLREP